MKYYKIAFKNNFHTSGENTTVRLGAKWVRRLVPGDELLLHDAESDGCSEARVAYVNSVYLCHLCDVTDAQINAEHDEVCRSREGLLKTLKRVYGDSVTNHSVVTVITYTC